MARRMGCFGIQMPAFDDHVKPEEIDALTAYVHWVRQHPRAAPPGG
jgi:mono/diheme cytochrome c family protein